jgi:hypothetical protein
VCSVNCGPQSRVSSTAETRDRLEREVVDGVLRLRWRDVEAWPGGISSPDYYRVLNLDGVGVQLPPNAAGREGWGPDPDFDGLASVDERRAGTDPLRMDTDGDGVPDFAEAQLGFDPLLADTDGDGVLDGEELLMGGTADSLDGDRDGLSELGELVYGTDARLADTDGDWLNDGDEVAQGFDPTNRDTDANGLPDVFETGEATRLLDIPMGLTLVDAGDLARSAQPVVEALLLYRTEEDVVGHVFDGNSVNTVYCFVVAQTWQCVEYRSGYFSRIHYLVNSASGGWVGTVQASGGGWYLSDVVALRPRDCQSSDAPTSPTDRDLDGLTNGRESSLGTDLLCPDTDGYGLYDGWEDLIGLSPLVYDTAGDELPDLYAAFNHSHIRALRISEDDDELGIPGEWQAGSHPLLADSDADGLLDHAEVALGTDPTLRMTQPGGRGTTSTPLR